MSADMNGGNGIYTATESAAGIASHTAGASFEFPLTGGLVEQHQQQMVGKEESVPIQCGHQDTQAEQCQSEEEHSQELRFLSPISLPSPRQRSSSPLHSHQQHSNLAEPCLSPFADNSAGCSAAAALATSVAFGDCRVTCTSAGSNSSKNNTIRLQTSLRKRSPSGIPQSCSPAAFAHSPSGARNSPRVLTLSPSQRLLFTDDIDLSPPQSVSPLALAAVGRGSPGNFDMQTAYGYCSHYAATAPEGIVRGSAGSPLAYRSKRRGTTGSLPHVAQALAAATAVAMAGSPSSCSACSRALSGGSNSDAAASGASSTQANPATLSAAAAVGGNMHRTGNRRNTADIGVVQRWLSTNNTVRRTNAAQHQHQQHRSDSIAEVAGIQHSCESVGGTTWQGAAMHGQQDSQQAVRFSILDSGGSEDHSPIRKGTPHPGKKRSAVADETVATNVAASCPTVHFAAAEHGVHDSHLPAMHGGPRTVQPVAAAGNSPVTAVQFGIAHDDVRECCSPIRNEPSYLGHNSDETATAASSSTPTVRFAAVDTVDSQSHTPIRHGTRYPGRDYDTATATAAVSPTVQFAVADSEGPEAHTPVRHGTPYPGRHDSAVAAGSEPAVHFAVSESQQGESHSPVRHGTPYPVRHDEPPAATASSETAVHFAVGDACNDSSHPVLRHGTPFPGREDDYGSDQQSGTAGVELLIGASASDYSARCATCSLANSAAGTAASGQHHTVSFAAGTADGEEQHAVVRHGTPFPGREDQPVSHSSSCLHEQQQPPQEQSSVVQQQCSRVSFALAQAAGAGERQQQSSFSRHGTPHPGPCSRGVIEQEQHDSEYEQLQRHLHSTEPALVRVRFTVAEGGKKGHGLQRKGTPFAARGRLSAEAHDEAQLQTEQQPAPPAVSVRFLCDDEDHDGQSSFVRHGTPHPCKSKPRTEAADSEQDQQCEEQLHQQHEAQQRSKSGSVRFAENMQHVDSDSCNEGSVVNYAPHGCYPASSTCSSSKLHSTCSACSSTGYNADTERQGSTGGYSKSCSSDCSSPPARYMPAAITSSSDKQHISGLHSPQQKNTETPFLLWQESDHSNGHALKLPQEDDSAAAGAAASALYRPGKGSRGLSDSAGEYQRRSSGSSARCSCDGLSSKHQSSKVPLSELESWKFSDRLSTASSGLDNALEADLACGGSRSSSRAGVDVPGCGRANADGSLLHRPGSTKTGCGSPSSSRASLEGAGRISLEHHSSGRMGGEIHQGSFSSKKSCLSAKPSSEPITRRCSFDKTGSSGPVSDAGSYHVSAPLRSSTGSCSFARLVVGSLKSSLKHGSSGSSEQRHVLKAVSMPKVLQVTHNINVTHVPATGVFSEVKAAQPISSALQQMPALVALASPDPVTAPSHHSGGRQPHSRPGCETSTPVMVKADHAVLPLPISPRLSQKPGMLAKAMAAAGRYLQKSSSDGTHGQEQAGSIKDCKEKPRGSSSMLK